MNTLNRKAVMAALLLAIGAGAFGAQAADTTPDAQTAQVRATSTTESPQFEAFENQMQKNSAPSYTPAEHRDAPKPRRTIYLPSPFNASDLASPGG